MINSYVEELEQIDLGSTSSPQQIDLMQGVLTTAITVQVDASVTISGGTTSGTVLSETPHNLLEWIGCERDNDWFVDHVPGQMLAQFQNYVEGRPPRFTTLTNGDAATTALQATYTIPLSLPFLVNPFETVGYFPPAVKTLKLWVKRIATVDIDTFTTGSDRSLALDSLTVRVFQHYAKRPAEYRPLYLPHYTMQDSDAISASQTNFRVPVQIDADERLAFLLQCFQRDDRGVSDIANEITLKSPQVDIIKSVPPATLQRIEERFYPGIDASAGNTQTGTHQARAVGYYGYNFTTEPGSRWGFGKSGMALDATRARGYYFRLDVTRTSGTELVRHMNVGLKSIPGWTRR